MMTKTKTKTAKTQTLKAPFPYFGGKSKVASLVWSRLGDVDNFIEPFCGSAAMLLGRPHKPRWETVNDMNCHIANFWRAVQADPAAVAHHANWPINEADLHARHWWLVHSDEIKAFRERIMADPDLYDAKIAGWWVWGAGCWIGGRWGATKSKKMPCVTTPRGVHTQRQFTTCAARLDFLVGWFRQIQDRLRMVGVCCGDWQRVCGSYSTTTQKGLTGVFLDPPYSAEAGRCNALYAVESKTVAHDVRAWCLERGTDPMMRICLAGYEGEHDSLEAEGWSVVAWKTQGGYANQSNKRGRANSKRERLWFSPHCLTEAETELFGKAS
jgi:hypothetical protein